MNFLSGGVLGGAAIDGSASWGSRSLLQSAWGTFAARQSNFGFPNSNAYVSMNYSANTYDKTIDVTTSAFATNFNRSAEAIAISSPNGQGGGYLSVQVGATSTSDYWGRPVRVTFRASFSSTIGPFNSGPAYNQFSFYVNGTAYINGTHKTKGTQNFSQTVTLNTTVGSKFTVGFVSYSNASVGFNMPQNSQSVATCYFNLQMSVSPR